jgi:hypothetical protein
LRGSKERLRAALKGDSSAYQQLEIQGADHFFRGLDDDLVARVRAWIGKQAANSKMATSGDPEADKKQQGEK